MAAFIICVDITVARMDCLCWLTGRQIDWLTRVPNLFSFKNSRLLRGYFHPLFNNLRGYHSVFNAASPSQDLSIKKSYFEGSICNQSNTHGFSLWIKCRIFDVDAALLWTVWTQIFGHKWKTNVNVLINKAEKKKNTQKKPHCVSCLTTMQTVI